MTDNRELWLMRKTPEELFELYRDERSRICQKDRKVTQAAVKHELQCRLSTMFRLLDQEEDLDVHRAFLCEFNQPALKSRDDPAWRE